MPNVEKLSVALTPDMAAELRAAVEAGDYGSVSEVVRDALRDWRLRRKLETLKAEDLRRLAQQGIASGPSLEAEAVFAGLRHRTAGRRSPAEAVARMRSARRGNPSLDDAELRDLRDYGRA